jgi:ketosteroid isomerase-like protein
MSQDDVQVVRDLMKAFNDRDENAVSAYAEDVEFRLIGGFSGMAGETLKGRGAVLRFAQEMVNSLQARFEVERLFETDGRVVLIASTLGAGDASGVPVEWRLGQIYTFRDGKISEVDSYWDAEEALAALRPPGP